MVIFERLFRKSINDAKKAWIDEGNTEEAKRILDTHIRNIHGFNIELHEVTGIFLKFQRALLEMRRHVGEADKKDYFKELIGQAEIDLQIMDTQLKGLIRHERRRLK